MFHGLRPGREWLGGIGFIMAVFGGIIAAISFLDHTEHASASHGSYGVSAPCYSRSENIWVVPVIIPEFKFRDIERDVFAPPSRGG